MGGGWREVGGVRGVVRGGVIRERPTYPAARCEAVRGGERVGEAVRGGPRQGEAGRRAARRGCGARVRGGASEAGVRGGGAASPVAMDNVRCVRVHVRASTHDEGEHREAAIARAQSRGSATAGRRGDYVLGAGCAGREGMRGLWGSAGAWSVCWAALGQERASPPRLQRGGELAARAGWGGHGRGGGGGRGARPGSGSGLRPHR